MTYCVCICKTLVEKMKFPLETIQVVLLLLTIELVTAFKLTVLHTNDLHSRFDEVPHFRLIQCNFQTLIFFFKWPKSGNEETMTNHLKIQMFSIIKVYMMLNFYSRMVFLHGHFYACPHVVVWVSTYRK